MSGGVCWLHMGLLRSRLQIVVELTQLRLFSVTLTNDVICVVDTLFMVIICSLRPRTSCLPWCFFYGCGHVASDPKGVERNAVGAQDSSDVYQIVRSAALLPGRSRVASISAVCETNRRDRLLPPTGSVHSPDCGAVRP